MGASYSKDLLWRVETVMLTRPGSDTPTAILRVSKSTSDGLAFLGDGRHRQGPRYMGHGWYFVRDCLTPAEVEACGVDLAELEEEDDTGPDGTVAP